MAAACYFIHQGMESWRIGILHVTPFRRARRGRYLVQNDIATYQLPKGRPRHVLGEARWL